MPSRIGSNFCKALKSNPAECAKKYKIINHETIDDLIKFKFLWLDPEKEYGRNADDINEITINNDEWGYVLKVHKYLKIEIIGFMTME